MMRRLRVLEVIPTLDRSGAEKQLTQLATHLDRDRFDVRVCALTRGGPFAQTLREAGVPVTILHESAKLDPLLPGRLKRLMLQWRVDLVHTWLFAANCYGRVAARAARTPVVVAGERCVDVWKGRWQLAIDRRLARHTDVVLGNSQGVAAFYRGVGVAPEKLRVIPNGVDASAAPEVDVGALRESLGVPADAFVLGVVGRLWPQKRVDRIVAAVDSLRKAGVSCRLLVVGEGPCRREIESLARDVGLGEVVRVLGHRDDVPALLRVMDVLVSASAFEGMPNVVMEAMAAQRPVVATDIPGTREVVAHGETGLLVPARAKRRTLGAALLELAIDPERRERMGRAGRRRLEREFSVERMTGAHADLYIELARAKGLDV